jgi:hypothetical protein
VCKSGWRKKFYVKVSKRACFPVGVHSVKDAKEYSFAGTAGGEGAHRSDPAAHFHEETFDCVGGSKFLPKNAWAIEELEERLQIAFDTTYCLRCGWKPFALPGAEHFSSLCMISCFVDVPCFGRAALLRAFKPIAQVA